MTMLSCITGIGMCMSKELDQLIKERKDPNSKYLKAMQSQSVTTSLIKAARTAKTSQLCALTINYYHFIKNNFKKLQ